MRDAVKGPLVSDERGHTRRVSAYFTQRTMHRLRTSRSIASWAFSLLSSAFFRRSRCSSSRSDSLSPPVPDASGRLPGLATQLPNVPSPPQIPRDLRNRLTRLGHNPYRTLTELRVEPALLP